MRRPQAQEVASAALAWLVRYGSQLTNFDPVAAPSEHHQTAVAEHALLLWLSRRFLAPDDWRSQCEVLQAAVLQAYGAPGFHGFIVHGPPESSIGALLIRLGLGEDLAAKIMPRHFLLSTIRQRNVVALERTPTRSLELRLVLDHLDIPNDLPTREVLLAASMLGREFNEASLRPTEIYVLTHLIAYLTDFGLAKDGLLDGATRGIAPKLVERLIKRMIGERHWDLVSELITCGHCLAPLLQSEHQMAWNALSETQESDGSFGALATAKTLSATLSDPAELRYETWLRNYHKCLVTVIAALTGMDKAQVPSAQRLVHK